MPRRQQRRSSSSFAGRWRCTDGHATLQGDALEHIWQQLERIFHFERLPAQPEPGWRSSFPLNDREGEFLEALLVHREEKLVLDPGMDDKEPLPPDVQLPARFRPVGGDGVVMRGPYTTRQGGTGKPWNYGRQFFNNNAGDFIWADGTYPMDQEAQRRFRHFAAAHPEEVLDAMERDPNLLIMGLPMLGPGGFDDGFDDENDDEFVGGGDGEEDDEDDGSDNF